MCKRQSPVQQSGSPMDQQSKQWTQKEREDRALELRHAPICKEIVGEWTLDSTINTSAFLKQRGTDIFLDVVFLFSNQKFLIEERSMTQIQLIGDEVLMEYSTQMGFKGMSTCMEKDLETTWNTTVVDGMLVTKHVQIQGKSKKYDVEMRFMKNGKLHIENHLNHWNGQYWNSVFCTRVYSRVQQKETPSTIQSTIIGTWEPVAYDGLDEYSVDTQNQWKSNPMTISLMSIFNEVHIQHGSSPKMISVLGEDKNGSKTYFENNALITEENGTQQTVRFVKSGLLFVTKYQDGSSFMVVYKRV